MYDVQFNQLKQKLINAVSISAFLLTYYVSFIDQIYILRLFDTFYTLFTYYVVGNCEVRELGVN